MNRADFSSKRLATLAVAGLFLFIGAGPVRAQTVSPPRTEGFPPVARTTGSAPTSADLPVADEATVRQLLKKANDAVKRGVNAADVDRWLADQMSYLKPVNAAVEQEHGGVAGQWDAFREGGERAWNPFVTTATQPEPTEGSTKLSAGQQPAAEKVDESNTEEGVLPAGRGQRARLDAGIGSSGVRETRGGSATALVRQ